MHYRPTRPLTARQIAERDARHEAQMRAMEQNNRIWGRRSVSRIESAEMG